MSKLMYKGLELRTRTSSRNMVLSDDDKEYIKKFVPKDVAQRIQTTSNFTLPFVLGNIGYDTSSLLISAKQRAKSLR